MELFVELTDHIDPTFIPFGNFVELLFDHRRKIIVHHIGKLLVEIIGHQHADIGRRKLVFLFPYMLAELFADNLPFFEFQLDIPPFAALAVLFNHIAARDDRRNRRRIGGRAADPQLFKPFDQRRLAVTRRTLRETLQRRNAFRLRPIPLFQRGQQRLFALLRLVFGRFGIQFQETVEQHGLARSDETLLRIADLDIDHRPFGLGRRHLRGDRPFPDQIVQPFFGRSGVDHGLIHVRRADRFVRFLCSFRFGFIVADFRIFFTEKLDDLRFRRSDRLSGQVHRIGTHISDIPRLVQPLRYRHRLAHRHTEFAPGFLLQRGRGERRGRRFFRRLALDVPYGKDGGLALFEQRERLLFGRIAFTEFGPERGFLPVRIGNRKIGQHPVIGRGLEIHDLALALDDQPYGHALNASGRQRRLDLFPQNRRQFESHQTIQNPARLLGIDQIQVDRARIFDGM